MNCISMHEKLGTDTHIWNRVRHCVFLLLKNRKGVIFEITDQGEAFNLLDYDAPELKQVVEEKRKGGLGIILVKKIMDEIEFESKNGKNICRLIKNFPA